jgi:4-hydroxybutyrate CoA-transferase
MTRWIEAEDAGALLKPGMTVFVAGVTSEPLEILEALENRGEHCAGVRFVSVTIPGINQGDFSALHQDARCTAFFATTGNRRSIADGRTEFIPMHYSSIYRYLERDLKIDAAVMQLSPAGQDGMHSLGISADFAPAVLDKAGFIIGEVNERQPGVQDAPQLPASGLDYAVACERPLATLARADTSDIAVKIGGHVAELVTDGNCIQVGIGAIPDAALAALSDRNDLGIHSGMISDAVMDLARSGNINGCRKSIDRGRVVSGATLGSQELIDWAAEAPQLSVRPVGYTHDSAVIAQIENFVSINSALEIDLFGQINADMLGGRQVSGTGGSVDMMRGAALSPGGKSVVALSSTTGDGKISRIVATLARNAATTALRTDIDYVVTEYGARRIRHLPVMERAAALIEIAHPDFRDSLRAEWSDLNRNS